MKSILLTLSLLVSGFISIKATPFTSSPLALDGAALTRTIVRPVLYVNETITTHLVMPENIKLVDLSTDKIAGNQCADNIVRLKPSSAMENQQFIGTVTLVGERNIALYDLLYTKNPKEAATLYYVPTQHLSAYQNPSVKMPSKEIAQYAWAIFCSDRKFYNIKSKAYGVSMRVNNIYSVGDYFFIDFSLHNHTNVKYDIEELRVKLMDKKDIYRQRKQGSVSGEEYKDAIRVQRDEIRKAKKVNVHRWNSIW